MLKRILIAGMVIIVTACSSNPVPTTSNPAEVTFRMKSANNRVVYSVWRKVNAPADAQAIHVGVSPLGGQLNFSYPDFQPITLKLDPGTYFLHSYRAQFVGSTFNSTSYCSGNDGWDNGKPVFMSFTVQAGDRLTLPEVTIDMFCDVKVNDIRYGVTIGQRFKRPY